MGPSLALAQVAHRGQDATFENCGKYVMEQRNWRYVIQSVFTNVLVGPAIPVFRAELGPLFSQKLVTSFIPLRCHNPRDHTLYFRSSENLELHTLKQSRITSNMGFLHQYRPKIHHSKQRQLRYH